MQRKILLSVSLMLLFLLPLKSFSQQTTNKGYQYILSLNNGLERKMYVNELMFDEEERYLIVNYGSKPTYIVAFEFGVWKPLAFFRLPSWVDFTGAYTDDIANVYVKTSRYSSYYYKLSIKEKTVVELPCDAVPRGCEVVEPKQSAKIIYTKDKMYMIDINKKNPREVRVYKKRM